MGLLMPISQARRRAAPSLRRDEGAASEGRLSAKFVEKTRQSSTNLDNHGMVSDMDLSRPFSVVTPSLDGDVLYRLALADAAFTPGRLHRLIPTASVDGVRKALNRLAVQGVVEATPVGHAVTYRLNRDHVAAGAILELASLGDQVLERIIDALGEWRHRPVYGAVFGSWARREAGTVSDLDLFLVQPDDAPADMWAAQVDAIERDATRWTGNDTRSLVLTENHVRQHPHDPVLRSILDEGHTVSGDPSWLASLVNRARRP
ncbi:nucleotidyltransferase domain-containing protein [Isoptericola cucumis]|uniref:nucleotidyltransferase domain-containing protein n=1 Tax=Isoptericola cucumis TaxID=1776856 RepID=UPI00320B917F